MTRRTARPMAALARQPGPSAPKPALIPSRAATGPLTISSGATFSSVVCTPRMLKAGSSMASRRPAPPGSTPAGSPPSRRWRRSSRRWPRRAAAPPRPAPRSALERSWASISSTRASVGGTIGRPSVQPRAQEQRVDLVVGIGAADRPPRAGAGTVRPAACARAARSPPRARRSVSSIHSPEARWPVGSDDPERLHVSAGLREGRPPPVGSGSASSSGSRGCRCARTRRRWCAAGRRSPRS